MKFYDDDGATPLAAADGELPRVAAERIRRSVDPKWILSGADKGGGASGGSGAGGGKGDWDRIRESAKQRHAAGGDVDALKNRRGALLPS